MNDYERSLIAKPTLSDLQGAEAWGNASLRCTAAISGVTAAQRRVQKNMINAMPVYEQAHRLLGVRFFLSVSFLPIRASIGPNHGWLVWFGVGA